MVKWLRSSKWSWLATNSAKKRKIWISCYESFSNRLSFSWHNPTKFT